MMKLTSVCVRHSDRFVLGPIDADIGGTTALVGRNGSGKSTLFRLITGFSDPDEGQVSWRGQPVVREDAHYKRRIGVLPQPLELPLWCSARELLNYFCRLRHITDPQLRNYRIDAMVEMWQVGDFLTKPLISCSYGMRKRVALCLALVHEPELIVFDEPLSGLDVSHIMSFQKCLQQRSDQGLMSLYSSHIMSFVADQADHVLVMSGGQMSSVPHWHAMDHEQRLNQLNHHLDPQVSHSS